MHLISRVEVTACLTCFLSPGQIFRPQDLHSLVSPLSLASPSRSRALHFSRPPPGPKASLCLSIRQAWLMPLPALPPPRKACDSSGSHQKISKDHSRPSSVPSPHTVLSLLQVTRCRPCPVSTLYNVLSEERAHPSLHGDRDIHSVRSIGFYCVSGALGTLALWEPWQRFLGWAGSCAAV